MRDAYLCDAVRTPIGRYGGSLSGIRTDDLGAIPIRTLTERNRSVDWSAVDDLYYGCANQAGEDNRNVARMSGLLAGLPENVPAMDTEPFVRFRYGCGRQCCQGHSLRRGATDDCRRC